VVQEKRAVRVVLTGTSGQLGSYLLDALRRSGHQVAAWTGTERGERSGVELCPVDVTDPAQRCRALEATDPEVVVHAAAISTAEGVRMNPARAWAVNVDGTAGLAEWCERNGRRLVYTSTDLVFDGRSPWNREDDPARPLLAYGRSKLEGEAPVLAAPRGLVVRVSLLYGISRSKRPTYLDRTLAAWRGKEPQSYFTDEFRTPLDLATAAEVLVRLVELDVTGLIHLGGLERLSRYELMRRVAKFLGIDERLVVANRQRDVNLPEPRPADVSLDTTRLAHVLPELKRPTVVEAVAAMVK
jgi:dTDP-4-dehydrorhamnose reductase